MEHIDYYLKLREKINRYAKKSDGKKNLWVKYLLLAPDFFYLLCKLIKDERINQDLKYKLGLAITYFITPIDLVPDFFISIGYLDDIVIAAHVLSGILKYVNADVLNEYWPANRDVAEVIEDIDKVADKLVHGDILKELLAILG